MNSEYHLWYGSRMQNIRALLLDLDGTLLDTREFIFRSTEHGFTHFGLTPPPREEIGRAVGAGFGEFYRTLLTPRNITDAEPFMAATHQFQLENFGLITPYPGVLETLQKLSERGLSFSVITNRRENTAIPALKHGGVFAYMHTVISGDTLAHPKPHALPLLTALERMNVPPVEAAMVGDSHIDIEAGKNAGTKTIRLTSGFHADALHDPEPDAFVERFEELLGLFNTR